MEDRHVTKPHLNTLPLVFFSYLHTKVMRQDHLLESLPVMNVFVVVIMIVIEHNYKR